VATRAVLICGALALSCGPHVDAGGTARAPSPTAAHGDAWSRLDFVDRHSVMTFTVLPNMARSWRDFDKTPYPALTCRTCHGKDAEAVSYRMPNPSLPPIDPAHPPAKPASQFMINRVVPEMIDLIETSPTHFGCNSCHPTAKKS
jgi:hypothetical protein